MKDALIHRKFTAAMLLALSAAFIGCRQGAPPTFPQSFKGNFDAGAMHFEFNRDRPKNRIPGRDFASVAYLQWCDDVSHPDDASIALVVWTDVESHTATVHAGRMNVEGAEGTFEFLLGDSLKMTCRTTDGRTGSLTVNDETLDLANGCLILVATVEGKLRTRQIQHNRLKRTPRQSGGYEEYENLSRDPEIIAFFGNGK